jgi:hypothetical protein
VSMSVNSLRQWEIVTDAESTVLSVDLRDAVGDRLFLSDRFTRDGVRFLSLNTSYPFHLFLCRQHSISDKLPLSKNMPKCFPLVK